MLKTEYKLIVTFLYMSSTIYKCDLILHLWVFFQISNYAPSVRKQFCEMNCIIDTA